MYIQRFHRNITKIQKSAGFVLKFVGDRHLYFKYTDHMEGIPVTECYTKSAPYGYSPSTKVHFMWDSLYCLIPIYIIDRTLILNIFMI